MNSEPMVTFIIPTLNSSRFLDVCFQSIRNQEYPSDKMEILVMDGGSKDATLELAHKYGARVARNERVLCEPGVVTGMKEAKGELCVIMGADNSLASTTWMQEMVKPFADHTILAAYPGLLNKKNDTWLTKYVNHFTDPFNHFVYGYANNPRTFKKYYPVLEAGENYEVYNFSVAEHPILAFDQGFMIRKSYGEQRPTETEYCDILPVIDIISRKGKMAYVYTISNYHATLNSGVRQFWRKQKWAIDNGFVKKPYGFMERRGKMCLTRKIKQYLWPFYSISVVVPLMVALYHVIIKKEEKEWFYHPAISFISGLILWTEAVRVVILRGKPLGSRQ